MVGKVSLRLFDAMSVVSARAARVPAPALRFALALSLLAALAAFGQEHPNIRKGFAVDGAYQAGEIDKVNMFNGNLVVQIPIGQRYPVGGSLSYGFSLTYNSKAWDMEEANAIIQGRPAMNLKPSQRSNAGLGWLFSFGRILDRNHPANKTKALVYESPDGSEHRIYCTLHNDEMPSYPCGDNDPPITVDPGMVQGYTRDGTYLRMKMLANNGALLRAAIEFPDGSSHIFEDDPDAANSQMRIVEMKDRFGNSVTFTYSADGKTWTIQDSHARKHIVTFASPPNSVTAQTNLPRNYKTRLSKIDLETWNGVRAVYNFTYDDTLQVRRGCIPSYFSYDSTPELTIPVLQQITIPTGITSEAYNFTYFTQNTVCESGGIKQLKLPTGGTIDYEYQVYVIPTSGCVKQAVLNETGGIRKRTVTASAKGDTTKYVWTYTTDPIESFGTDACSGNLNNPIAPVIYKALRNSVTSVSTGEIVTHFFSIWPKEQPSSEGFKREEYGLPLTHHVAASGGRFLSTTTQFPSNAVKVSNYVLFEMDAKPRSEVFASMSPDRNRRISATRTVYGDSGGGTVDTKFESFDGLGHYRQVTTDGTFEGANQRVIITNYNPGKALPPGEQELEPPTLPHDADWLLDTFPTRTVTETVPGVGTSTLRSELCFDARGFLKAQRTLLGPTASGNDVLVTFAEVGGNVVSEKYFGGDKTATSTGCDPLNGQLPQYEVTRLWSFGAVKESGYASSGFLSINNTIDKSTGLVTTSKDSSDILTTYTYDVLGRVKTVTPESGHGPAFAYTYNFDQSPYVEAVATGSTGEVGRRFVRFDTLGRVFQEFNRMPEANAWSARGFEYDAYSRQTKAFQPGAFTGDPKSSKAALSNVTTFQYDYLGRATEITPPDGAAHKVSHTFSGIAKDVETVFRANGSGTERQTSTTRYFDRFGRLAKVEEPAQATAFNHLTGLPATTTYTYDAADRLTAVKMVGEATQNRTFVYDARGFLTKETSPESGDVVYTEIDARGHAGKRAFAGKTLSFTYDKAERPDTISDATGILKDFNYSSANTTVTTPSGSAISRSKGKLQESIRRNDLAAARVDVTETYEYTGAAGQVSKRTTAVEKVSGSTRTPIQTFTYKVDYDDVLLPKTITMPTCAATTPCPTSDGLATVVNKRTEGFLTEVENFGSITYYPSGMVKSVEHASTAARPTDNYAQKNDMARPSRITFSGCSDLKPYFLPGSFLVKTNNTSCGLQVTWPAAVSCGSGAGIKYRVQRNGATLASCITETKYIDTTVTPGGSYSYKITAEGPAVEGVSGGCQNGKTIDFSYPAATFQGCSTQTNLTVSAVVAPVAVTVPFTATLSSGLGPVQDEELIFNVNGREIGRARTAANGTAIIRTALDIAPGFYAGAINVIYAGGVLPAKSVTADLTVACSQAAYTVRPLFVNALQTATPAGQPVKVLVNTSSRCKWTAVPDPGFLQVAPLTQQTGSKTFDISLTANPTASSRSAKVRVNHDSGFTDVTVQQSGNGCTYSFTPEVAYMPAESASGTATIDVATASTCAWTVSSDASWLTIVAPFPPPSGPGTIRFHVEDNTNPNARRVGHLILKQGGVEVARANVNQDALPPAVMPVLVEDLRGGTVNNGRYIPLRVYVTGNQLKYRWFINNNLQPECSGPACAWKLIQKGEPGYPSPGQSTTFQVQVYNSAGTVASSSVSWTNNTPTGSTCSVPIISDTVLHGPSGAPSDTISPRPGAAVTFLVMYSNADGSMTGVTSQWYTGLPGDTSTMVPNGTNVDQITVNPRSAAFYWLAVSNACGTQWSRSGSVMMTTPPPRRRAVTHDMNADGRQDVLWHNAATGANEVWLMNGTAHTSTVALAPSSLQMQTVADINADDRTDILLRNPATGANELWLMNGTTRSSVVPLEARTGAGWTIGAAADYDNDGSDDIVWHNSATGENEIWFQSGTAHAGTWALPNSGNSGLYGTADFNNDEKPDLFFHNRATGQNSIWLMDDAERQSQAKSGGLPTLKAVSMAVPSQTDLNFAPAEVADFNGDGKPDILWRNPATGENKVWVLTGTNGTTVSSTVSLETRTGTDWQIGGGGSNNSGGSAGGGDPTAAATQLTVVVDPTTLGKATAATATLLSGATPVPSRLLVFSRSGTEIARVLTGADGIATAVVDVTGLAAGTYAGAVTVRFDGDTAYRPATTSANLVVTGDPAIVTWNNPPAILYGTPLSAAQLNATASVPGTFVYSPPSGAIVDAGFRTLSLTFTPTDPAIAAVQKTAVILVNQAPSSVTWVAPGPISYGTPLSATQLRATSALSGTFTYNPAQGMMLAVGSRTLSVTFEPDSPNYLSSTASTTLVVEKGRQLVLWSDPAPIVVQAPLTATQLNARVIPAGTDPAGAVTYTPPLGTVLPEGVTELRVDVAATASYDAATAVVDIQVVRLPSPLTFRPTSAIVYGLPLGPQQLFATSTISGTFVFDPPAGTILGAGTHQLTVAFTPADSRYLPATASVPLLVLKAGQTVTFNPPAPIAYGTPLSEVQLNATSHGNGPDPGSTLVYTPPAGTVLNAGTWAIIATAPGTDNYNDAAVVVQITVNKATPVITWPKPAPISYGTILSATQLNATADVPGTFFYTPGAGARLNVGAGQTLSVTFTPSSNNYTTVTATTTIDVTKGQQTITWAKPSGIRYGMPLSNAQLNATVQVPYGAPGALTYSPPLGAMLDAGLGRALTVTAAATDVYDAVTKTVSIDLSRAPLLITSHDQWKEYGQPNPRLTGTFSGVVNNDPITIGFTTQAGAYSSPGEYPITSSLTDPNNRLPNYDVTETIGTLTVYPAQLEIQAAKANKQYSDPLPTPTALYYGFAPGEGPEVLEGELTFVVTAEEDSAPGTYWTYVGGDVHSPNYDIAFAEDIFKVTAEDARVVNTTPPYVTAETAGPTTIHLFATVQDISATADANGDTAGGDIRNATLTFVDRATGATLCTAPLGLIGADQRTAVGTCTFSRDFNLVPLPATLTIGTVVGGYYTRNNPADDLVLNIDIPPQDRIVGLGKFTIATAGGLNTPAIGSEGNVDFSFRYVPEGENRTLAAICRVTFTGNNHRYALTVDAASLAIHGSAPDGEAYVVGTGTVMDETAQQTLATGIPFIITATDHGADDRIGFALYKTDGGLWSATGWNGVRMVEQPITSGSIRVEEQE